MDNIDCEFTKEIVCPYCGHTFSDSWEYCDFDDEMFCDECGNEFSYERKIEVTYVSYKND